jgi:hypothetical protein
MSADEKNCGSAITDLQDWTVASPQLSAGYRTRIRWDMDVDMDVGVDMTIGMGIDMDMNMD